MTQHLKKPKCMKNCTPIFDGYDTSVPITSQWNYDKNAATDDIIDSQNREWNREKR